MNSSASSGHDLHAVTVRVVLPAEADDAVGGADEPLVGDGHAVRIAAEVLEDLRRPGEGALSVHDPGVVAKVPEPGGEGVRISEGRERAGEDKRAGGEGAVKGRQVLAAEDRREGADREEEAGGRGDPARPVPTERAPGDDTVQMQVLGEVLAPGMEDGRAAEVTAEMARIAAKGGQRGGDGAEQERVDHAGIALGERVQGMRQREDDVEVLDGKQFGLAGGEPALFGEGLALGAVAVAAGIVGEALGPTGITRLAMATERGGTARLDGLHRAALRAGQPMGVAIRRAVGAEDVGDLHRGTLSRARRPGGRPRRTHRLGQAAGLGQIQGRAGAHEVPLNEMDVPHRRRDLAMAEQALHGVQVDARFEEVGGEGVAQGVDAALLADAGAELRQRIDLLSDRDVDRAGALAIGEEPDAGGAVVQYARNACSRRGESGR
jgi:hypothetical protein